MAKQEWTPERRAAFGEKMKASRAKKEAEAAALATQQKITPVEVEEFVEQVEPSTAPLVPVSHAEPPTTVQNGEEDYKVIMARALEAIATLQATQNQGSQPQGLGIHNGRMVGTIEKYAIDPSLYPSPTERLKLEPRLQRFAFAMNYELEFQVSSTSYETKNGLNYTEPQFKLELNRIMMDPDTGDATAGRYTICRLVMHEDPQTAMVIARENGIDIDTADETAFLNEMRYIQIRNWLLECFYPPKAAPEKQKKEMVIDGKLVDYFEINSEQVKGIPFKELTSKL